MFCEGSFPGTLSSLRFVISLLVSAMAAWLPWQSEVNHGGHDVHSTRRSSIKWCNHITFLCYPLLNIHLCELGIIIQIIQWVTASLIAVCNLLQMLPAARKPEISTHNWCYNPGYTIDTLLPRTIPNSVQVSWLHLWQTGYQYKALTVNWGAAVTVLRVSILDCIGQTEFICFLKCAFSYESVSKK